MALHQVHATAVKAVRLGRRTPQRTRFSVEGLVQVEQGLCERSSENKKVETNRKDNEGFDWKTNRKDTEKKNKRRRVRGLPLEGAAIGGTKGTPVRARCCGHACARRGYGLRGWEVQLPDCSSRVVMHGSENT